MRARGTGRIVNITSIGGMISVPHLLPYNCAKFAAVGLSQGLRAELASDGIRVTTIVPGVMRVGSYLNAEFRGRADREYQWFALGSAVPGPSMCGERAARQILRAVKRGDAFRTLGMPAAVAERVNGLMPGTVARVMSLVGRLMPRRNGAGPGEIKTGWQAAQETDSRAFDAATAAGYNAAERTNQLR
jgi:short-subunit dehydrogenase